MTKPESRAVPISFEFFPPREAEGRTRLIHNVASKLAQLAPEYFSVTYGAGGTTKQGTRQTVDALIKNGFKAAPHLSMGADDIADIKQMLDDYQAAGVTRIVALRGDQPSGLGSTRFAHNAEALVRLIREHSETRLTLRSPLTLKFIPTPKMQRPIWTSSNAKLTREPAEPSRSISTMPTPTKTFSSEQTKQVSPYRSLLV